MPMERGVLLTGATGFIGGEILVRFLRRDPARSVYCLIRARDVAELDARRLALIDWAGLTASEAERVVAVAGDIALPELGLGNQVGALAAAVDEIIHTAASTKFDLELEDARRINRGGASHVLAFARRADAAGGLRRLHHVSTAYVAGAREGTVEEADSVAPPAFRNTYEQTKWEAEQLLDPEDAGVPVTCYRPSIVVGDSRTGRTRHFRVLYDPVRWIYTGKIDVLPCRPEVRLDVVPVDFVCDALLAIGERPDSVGQTYHLTCGPEAAMSIDEIVDVGVAQANRYNREAGLPELAAPKIVSPDAVSSGTGEEREKLEALFAIGRNVMETHVPYMVTEQLFDTKRTRQALEGTGISCPPLRSYFPVMFRWGAERGFSNR